MSSSQPLKHCDCVAYTLLLTTASTHVGRLDSGSTPLSPRIFLCWTQCFSKHRSSQPALFSIHWLTTVVSCFPLSRETMSLLSEKTCDLKKRNP